MYRVVRQILGLTAKNGILVAQAIPSGSIIRIVGTPQRDGTIDIEWNEIQVNVFVSDLDRKGHLARESLR
jgi:hypothetical protein